MVTCLMRLSGNFDYISATLSDNGTKERSDQCPPPCQSSKKGGVISFLSLLFVRFVKRPARQIFSTQASKNWIWQLFKAILFIWSQSVSMSNTSPNYKPECVEMNLSALPFCQALAPAGLSLALMSNTPPTHPWTSSDRAGSEHNLLSSFNS